MKERETFASRLGFVLISAGCAIGLGNVWRFPYIVGRYGGAAFVLIYLAFLVILGLPIMAMEFSVGRASRQSIATSFHKLEPKGTKWHWYSWFGMAGNYMLMMFYTTVAGWMILYCINMAKGDFVGADTQAVQDIYSGMLSNPGLMLVFMILVILIGMGVCSLGLQDGVEKITKVMMVMLLAILIVLVVRSVTLENAMAGLEFYLKPNFHNLMYDANGNFILGEAIFAAMGQSFFTLSLGIGAMAIFGSYIGKDRALLGESVNVAVLDTFVAITSGLIIFPACFTYGVEADSGPNLIFITLPNVFNHMPMGQLWGSLFFVFLFFASMSTILAVFENIMACWMDLTGMSRRKVAAINLVLMLALSLPCVLGFNLWSGFQPFGDGSTIMDLEDFLVSNIWLPIGSLIYLLFCTSRYGWGWKNFTQEANTGKGLKVGNWMRWYVTYLLPIVILAIFLIGINDKFHITQALFGH